MDLRRRQDTAYHHHHHNNNNSSSARSSSVGILESSRPSSPPTSSSDEDAYLVAQTPTFEYYGFVIYLVSLAAFVLYLIWAYLPDKRLESIGITYYPDRYWALALPAWWLMAVGFIYVFNMAANMYNTPPLSSMDCITDQYSNISDHNVSLEAVGGIPPVCDIPISLVNQYLYQDCANST